MSKSKESSVKVGLRVRPLVSKENGQGITITENDYQSLQFKGQTYTFDHVFGRDVSQVDLYTETAAPMLKSFLDGYNCTIMAYGQTGSGKTYTMGTSDLNDVESESNQGLIPRFVNDLFENLNHNANTSEEKTSFKIRASFLEIYGEDVYDLIGIASSPSNSRVSLPVREDESGRVFVQGQNEVDVSSVEAALEVLCSGSNNRITASTAMNAGSSRSHAVFTLSLEQSVQSAASPDDLHIMSSKLTFVDLAGSERIKRTGAEGQRMKEGIQINSGLFNLGQVINSLADEQKLKNNVKSFVPYRNSKLTHLLKDALGGNSQTLFLACVSPAESNESETQSTLTYARQARNIQNKPVKNVDKTQQELRRLKYAVKAWMMKAVTHMFGSKSTASASSGAASSNGIVTPTKASQSLDEWNSSAEDEEALLSRPDVIEFINSMNASITDRLHGSEPSPRKVRLSIAGGIYSPSPVKGHHHNHHGRPLLFNSKRPTASAAGPTADGGIKILQPLREDALLPAHTPAKGRSNTLDAPTANNADDDGMEALLSTINTEHDPEETERLVSRMLDMVSKEREAYLNENANPNANAGIDIDELQAVRDSEILEMENEIVEKEAILNKLMDQVKGYAAMKQDFERLLEVMYNLETEKHVLENELEQAKKVAEANAQNGKYTAANHAEVERIKERFLKVQSELKTLKSEKAAKESSYKKMCKDSKQCDALLSDIQKLKDEKVNMMKQNKLQSQQFAKLKKDQVQKIGFFKKADIKKRQQLNTLKSELLKKERILLHKEKEITRVTNKLKASEEHITQLLKLQAARNKSSNIGKGGSGIGGAGSNNNNNGGGLSSAPPFSTQAAPGPGKQAAASASVAAAAAQAVLPLALTGSLKAGLSTADQEFLTSTKNLIDNICLDAVERKQDIQLYNKKATYLKQLNKQLLSEAYELDELMYRKRALFKELSGRYDPSYAATAAALAAAGDSEEGAEEVIDEDDTDMNTFFSFDFSAAAAGAGGAVNGKKASARNVLAVTPSPMKVLFNKLSEDDRYAVQSLKLSLTLVENAITRLTKLIDVYNGDIDELSLRMQERGTPAMNATDSSDLNSWELLSKDLVLNLTLPQCQGMLLDTIGERCNVLVQCNTLSCDMMRLSSENSNYHDKLADLNRYITVYKTENKLRMDAMEKSHATSLWNAVNQSSGTKESDNVAVKVAVERANTMEAKWSEASTENTRLAEQNKENLNQINTLRDKVSDLSLLLQSNESNDNESQSSSAYMEQLLAIWNKVGLSAEERSETLSYVNNAKSLARSRVVLDAEANLIATIDEASVLAGAVNTLSSAMGKPLSSLIVDNEPALEMIYYLLTFKAASEDPSMLPAGATLTSVITLLTSAQAQLLSDFESVTFASLRSLKDKIMDIVSDMLLNIGELPALIQPLMKVTLTKEKESPNEQAFRVCKQLNDLKLSCSDLPIWEAEIQKLNLVRVQMVTQLITIRDETVKLSMDLNMCDLKQLNALVGAAAAEAAGVTPEVMGMAVQLIAANSASNPPGSQKLFAAIQHIKLVLDSVKVNRATVCRLIGQYIQLYQSEFTEATLLISNNREQLVSGSISPAGTFSTQEVNELFTIAEEVSIHTLQYRKQLETYLSSAIFDMTSGSEDTIKFQIITLLNGKMGFNSSSKNGSSSSNNHSVAVFNAQLRELIEELSGASMFIEEKWIQECINDIVMKWDASIVNGGSTGENSLKTIMTENWWLREELTRLTALGEAHKELLRADASLAAHVVEMEEFEAKSKQDRLKALSGNSKLLMEEEKFRKNGKKKYEQITDKMLQVFHKLSALLSQNSAVTSPTAAAAASAAGGIDIKIDFTQLSSSGQALLKDKKFKEKIELMHLKVSAN